MRPCSVVPWGEIRLGRVEVFQQQLLFGSRHHRQLIEGGARRLLQGCHQVVQRGLQVGANALWIDLGGGQQTQDKTFAQVVDTQGQWVVGALIRTQCLDALPRRHGFAAVTGAAVAIVE